MYGIWKKTNTEQSKREMRNEKNKNIFYDFCPYKWYIRDEHCFVVSSARIIMEKPVANKTPGNKQQERMR